MWHTVPRFLCIIVHWGTDGHIFKIIGLIDSDDRIAPEIKETNLIGSVVLFTQHINQYTPREKRPTARQLLDIKRLAN